MAKLLALARGVFGHDDKPVAVLLPVTLGGGRLRLPHHQPVSFAWLRTNRPGLTHLLVSARCGRMPPVRGRMMFRSVLTVYLLLITVAGPCASCCTAARLTNLPTVSSDSATAVEPASHCCAVAPSSQTCD